ncbi:MAG: pimeloyl-ACP methyl ester carboxylesterase [Pseudohongiellaceae bacterium]|jgi:pimeloyl-ACP methyl ester carboxylesterase
MVVPTRKLALNLSVALKYNMMTKRADSTDIDFTFNDFRYAAQLWGKQHGLPVIALHGWLDNSASFDILAPQLTDVHFLAPDLAGHGYSDRYNGLSDYPVWSEVMAIFEMADHMGWQEFALIGHSRGAMMSVLAASMFPERISHLVLVDALGPYPVAADQLPKRMQASVAEMKRRLRRKLSCYKTYEAAINARLHSEFGQLMKPTAERLATRGLSKLPQGYHWHGDGKLWAPSMAALTQAQISACIDNISAKVLLVLTTAGLNETYKVNVSEEAFTKLLSDNQIDTDYALQFRQLLNKGAVYQEFDDGHYLHMESSAEAIAAAVQGFLFS